MSTLNEKQFRATKIINFYRQNNEDLPRTLKHFKNQNYSESTIRRAVKRYTQTGSSKFKTIPGRKADVMTNEKIKRMTKAFEKNPETSVREMAAKLSVAPSTLQYWKLKEGVIGRKKKTAPKYTEDQEVRVQKGAGKLYKKLIPSGGAIVIDDETFVPVDPSQVPGNRFINYRDISHVKDKNLFKQKTKFYKHFLVWQTIDEQGRVSEPFITNGTINGKIYDEECIKKRLLPFIKEHYKIEDVLFWPDMATSHYSTEVINLLKSENLDYVTKKYNLPNFPQERPIENFLALCKQQYKKRKQPAKSLQGFKRIWQKVSQDVAEKSGKKLSRNVKKNLRLARDQGPLSALL
ncbi:hypothetical protein ILUMI_03558 [Ignelater luminosus]|uniref:Transposase n=1 Tax=Ignelater luminosus TaxID=2038154 RepID=A0A8K0GJU1_IGNLU|nr:hypothetical protein ILUMI_03558 [Ignelater luminosus]